MVRQGDIIKINFSPQSGHEQSGYRPAVIVSNDIFNKKAKLVMVCPITNTKNNFPMHVPLDSRTKTTGVILCEHVRTLDIESRKFVKIEKLPKNILEEVINMVCVAVELI